jgi:hypothetical protein
MNELDIDMSDLSAGEFLHLVNSKKLHGVKLKSKEECPTRKSSRLIQKQVGTK